MAIEALLITARAVVVALEDTVMSAAPLHTVKGALEALPATDPLDQVSLAA